MTNQLLILILSFAKPKELFLYIRRMGVTCAVYSGVFYIDIMVVLMNVMCDGIGHTLDVDLMRFHWRLMAAKIVQ